MRKLGVVVTVLLLALVSCRRDGRVIPASTLSDIYADMFMADQWVAQNSRARRTADTSDFYGPIFDKYGYTVEDYDASVRHYLQKPDKYAKILKGAGAKLSKQEKRLQAYEDAASKVVRFSPYVPTKFRYDTLRFRDDTLGLWPNDSSFVVPSDSVAVDSLAVSADSLARADFPVRADSSARAGAVTIKKDKPYGQKEHSEKVLLLYGPDDAQDRGHSKLR